MQTRSKYNLSNVKIQDIMLNHNYKLSNVNQPSKTNKSITIINPTKSTPTTYVVKPLVPIVKEFNPKQSSQTQMTNNNNKSLPGKTLLVPEETHLLPRETRLLPQQVSLDLVHNQELAIQHTQHTPLKSDVKMIKIHPTMKPFARVCIFDTETFTDKKIPIQIAWDIFEISNGEMTLIESRMFYITEVWVLSNRRNDLKKGKYFTQNTLKKHEIHLQNTGFPLKTARETLQIFTKDITACDYIAAFNIEWDINSINNMIREFDLKCINPIEEHKKLDIMYMVYESFSEELINAGIDNNIINKMGIKYDSNIKGVCTAEYMNKVLLNSQAPQMHLADQDVKLEQQLMNLCLKKTGTILYTKSDLPIYKEIQNKAKIMYPNAIYCKQKNVFNHIKCLSCNDTINYGDIVYRTRDDDFHCEFCYDTQIDVNDDDVYIKII
jgi:hypothetical protein